MAKMSFFVILLQVVILALAAPAQEKQLTIPTPQQAAWHDDEIGAMICIGIETWQDNDTDHNPKLENAQLFNPIQLDTDQWVRAVEAFGGKYIVLVAKHHGGFCLWQTDTTPYSIKNSPYKDGKGDIVAELAESCRRRDMKLGVYLSPADFRFGAVMGGGGKTANPADQPLYDKIYRQQLTELLSRYGEMMEVWFDGSLIIDVGDILKKYAPHAMIFQGKYATIRWVGNEAGYAPYPAWNAVKKSDALTGVATARHGDPAGDVWLPNECDTVIRDQWFWNSTNAKTLKSVDKLMDIYYNSVGHGAVLLLNIAPDISGRIPRADVERAAEFGAEIKRRFGKNIAQTTGQGNVVELAFDAPTVIDHAITMEDILQGERIREYVIEGYLAGQWQPLAAGTAVGHKKIDVFEPIRVSKIRLRVTRSVATPLIRKLAVYRVSDEEPLEIAPASEEPIGCWNMDSIDSGKVSDASPNKIDGTVHGAIIKAGIAGNALSFDGQDDYVSLGTRTLFTRDFTITAWINPRETAQDETIIVSKEREHVSANQFRLYLANGNRLGFMMSDKIDESLWPFEASDRTIPANRWSHVAVVRNGQRFSLYLNGSEITSKAVGGDMRHRNREDFRIGAGTYTGTAICSGFEGLIDEVRIYNRPLSEKEIASSKAAAPIRTNGISVEGAQPELAKPTPQQAAWQDDEIGMFIHFGLETWQDKESDDETTMENLKLFDPPHVDTEQWVDVAESIGAKYIILVAKHVGGFCLWQTDSTEYSIKNSPYKNGQGDILKDLSETCRRRGMKLGVYIYPGSIFHGAGIGVGGKTSDPSKQKEYDRIYRQQLTEVLSQYGKMYEVWFDGSVTIPVKDILDKYAPKAMVFQGPQATIRWVGNERGYAPYPAWNAVKKEVADSGVATGRHGNPDGERWLPNEVDTVIRDHYWFWNSYNEKDLKSLDKLMDIYYNSVGHSSVLLLNIAPDTSGRIPQADVKRAAEFGAEIKRRFGESIAQTKGSGEVIELTLDKPVTIDHVITMEDIVQGERVCEYVIEGFIDGNWEQIVEGISIGHKKIDKFGPVAVEAVRIRVTKSAAKPIIRKLAIYNVSGEDLTTKLAKPTPQQADWMDMEIGMFIHFGIETWQDKETDDEPDMANVKLFNPTNVDTDQWVTVAVSMGAKYIILVAKHHGGFCLWQTDTTPYSIKNSPYKNGKGDIVAELAESCKKRGMNLGMYLSPADFRFGAVMGGGGKTAKPEDQPIYDKIYRQQLREVLGRYGEMMEVWFDGSLIIEVGDILEKYAPKAMVFQGKYATIRWVGNEQGYASYPAWNAVDTRKDPVWAAVAAYTIGDGDPDGDFWLPNECDTVIRDHYWFWNTYSQDKLKSLEHLMDIYYKSVGYSSVLLMNVAPDRSGRIPEADVIRAAEFGAEIKRRFGKSIAETSGQGKTLELTFDHSTIIDHAITMEDIFQGERVREYIIEGRVEGDWKIISKGTAIGHKKIDRFEPVAVTKVRLRVTKSAAIPLIRKLAAYNTTMDRDTQAKISDISPKTQSQDSQVVFKWGPEHIKSKFTKLEFDLSAYIDEPTQYELIFKKTGGKNDLEIKSVVLLLSGVEIPGFTEPLDAPNTFNINITATPSRKKDSIKFRAILKGKGGNDSFGQVIIHKIPIQ